MDDTTTRITIDGSGWVRVKAPPGRVPDLMAIAWAGRHRRDGEVIYPAATPALALTLQRLVVGWGDPAVIPCRLAAMADDALATEVRVKAIREQAERCAPVPGERFPSYPHQRLGHHLFNAGEAFMAAWDMRTGKTKFAIDAIDVFNLDPVLILCPNPVVPVWVDHFQTHGHDGVDRRIVTLGPTPCSDGTLRPFKNGVAGKYRAVKRAWDEKQHGLDPRPLVVVCNYESIWRPPLGPTYAPGRRARVKDWGWVLSRWWAAVFADESHRFGKPDTKISRFMERLHGRARKRCCLTGTPMSHSPLDIFGQYRFLDPTIFGAFWTAFRSRYAKLRPMAVGGGRSVQIVDGFQHLDDLEQRFHTIATVVKLADVVDLPPITDERVPVEMDAKQRRVYRSLADDFFADVGEGVVTVRNALSRIIRLQQATSGFVPLEDADTGDDLTDAKGERVIEQVGDAKAKRLRELLDDLPADEPVAVFCRFRVDLDQVHSVAKEAGRPSCELSGRINEIGHRWTPDEDGMVAAVQIQAGKEGLDLSVAAYSVVFSTGCPSVGDFDQLMARQLGPQQKRPVVRYHLCVAGTVDDQVYTALQQHRDVIESIVASREAPDPTKDPATSAG